jgi:hypothetical protein
MNSAYSVFFVSKSDYIHSIDFYSKIILDIVRPRLTARVTRVRFLASFFGSGAAVKAPIMVRSLVGLITQLFFLKPSPVSNSFGLKNSVDTIQFWKIQNSFNLNYFWVYCPNSIISNLIPIGIKGKKFRYLRFIMFDIFNFFGPGFYQSFHMNYFDFPGIFSLDFFFERFNSRNPECFQTSSYELRYIKLLLSFTKNLI